MEPKPLYLNVGCGRRFFRGEPWVNLDVSPADASVLNWNVRKGFPMGSATVDAIYFSHVLEHFSEEHGARLVTECLRALKPGGLLRLVVPDLEGICREYLHQLELARTSPPGYPGRLAWIKLELLDQCLRHESGGTMRTYFRNHGLSEINYVVERIGTVGRQLAKAHSPTAGDAQAKQHVVRERTSLRASLLNALMTPEEAEALRVGQFRMGGEVHLHMYDSVSLEQLLQKAGFERVTFHRAGSSDIRDWARYHLDLDADGQEHAPHSLYAEGRKGSS